MAEAKRFLLLRKPQEATLAERYAVVPRQDTSIFRRAGWKVLAAVRRDDAAAFEETAAKVSDPTIKAELLQRAVEVRADVPGE